MPSLVAFTDKRPGIDAWHKEKMIEALITRIDKDEKIDATSFDAIVKDANIDNAPAGVSFLKRLAKVGAADLRTQAFSVLYAVRGAKQGYEQIDDAQPRAAGVYGLELAKTLEQWDGAHNVLAKAQELSEKLKMGGTIDTAPAEATIAKLTPTLRAFADSYDAMLRGDKAVSDVMPEATMFAFFPELKGKDLPALHDALADLVSRADKGALVGLFNHRWLEFGVSKEYRVEGPLQGDLNMFVAYLRRDAQALRNGSLFGPSESYGRPGTDPIGNYLKSSRENPEEGYGLIPALLYQLALPAYMRETLTFGDESRKKAPTFANKAAPPLTMRVEEVSGAAGRPNVTRSPSADVQALCRTTSLGFFGNALFR